MEHAYKQLHEKQSQAYEFEIFNRWGDKVFETNDVFEWWDGAAAPTDVYSWALLITDELGAERKETGLVTLIR